MDLLISVDTSLVHLAASIGVPVWMLVRFSPDWRWQLHRTDSPWYPSLRLFRQVDWKAKIGGKLIFLKNGRDPARIRQFWASCVEKRPLDAILALATGLESNLDNPAANQIDDLVTDYFSACGFDTQNLTKLRLFFIAQLDDYLRAVKATRIA